MPVITTIVIILSIYAVVSGALHTMHVHKHYADKRDEQGLGSMFEALWPFSAAAAAAAPPPANSAESPKGGNS